MLPLFLAFVVYFFLFLGAIFFTASVLFPRFRRYALSAGLWWAVWGPCSAGAFLLFLLRMTAKGFVIQASELRHWDLLPPPQSSTWYVFFIAAVIFNICAATLLSYLHEAMVRRMTFAQFRVYATVVTTGIGSVFGWGFGFWLLGVVKLSYQWIVAVAGMTVLVGVYSLAGFRLAAQLRARPDEFYGTPSEVPVE